MAAAFVCLIEVELHFEAHDLKQKRKLVKSLKDGLRQRFGAAVAETGHHDKWQRASLLVALVGGSCAASRTWPSEGTSPTDGAQLPWSG